MALRYLLDTNVLSEPTRPVPDPGVLQRLDEHGPATFATAAPAWHELAYGRARLPAGRRRRAIESIIDAIALEVEVLPYDTEAAQWHASQRARLTGRGLTPSFVDGQIAAVAAVNKLVLVTRNVRDFARFTGVRVESWFSTR
jgi:tRNA(fMet)-specific endonuclease VapC